MTGADLREADLRSVQFNEAVLTNANLRGCDLSGMIIRGHSIRSANPEDAQSLENTDLRGVKGLSKEQLVACKAKGAIVDADAMNNASQLAVLPSSECTTA